MTAQILDRVLTVWRIGDPQGAFKIFNVTGPKLYPGRWTTAATPMTYTGEHYSTAMLEKLAHGSGYLPPNQHFIEITIPNGVSYEMVSPARLHGWGDQSCDIAQAFGAKWQRENRSLLLFVPSVVARMEKNIPINAEHAEFGQVTASLHQPVWWDERQFSNATPAHRARAG